MVSDTLITVFQEDILKEEHDNIYILKNYCSISFGDELERGGQWGGWV